MNLACLSSQDLRLRVHCAKLFPDRSRLSPTLADAAAAKHDGAVCSCGILSLAPPPSLRLPPSDFLPPPPLPPSLAPSLSLAQILFVSLSVCCFPSFFLCPRAGTRVSFCLCVCVCLCVLLCGCEPIPPYPQQHGLQLDLSNRGHSQTANLAACWAPQAVVARCTCLLEWVCIDLRDAANFTSGVEQMPRLR